MTKSDSGATPRTRRAFLHNLAAAGGAAVAAPALAGTAWHGASIDSSAALRVGVVPPALRDGLGDSWLAGMRLGLGLGLGLAGAPVNLELAAPASATRQAADSARRMARDGADLVVGSLTPHAASQVALALRATSTPFLNAEAGAQRLHAADYQPNLFQHSLHLWQASYAAGAWAAQNRGRRAATLASFNESGYDTVTAFTLGFESAGGRVVEHAVSRAPGQPQSPRELVAGLRAQAPDFIYVSARGVRAEELLAAAGSLALAAPMARADGAADPAFVQACAGAGVQANAFTLLGYEAGRLILAAAADRRASGEVLGTTLARAAFDGPRGTVRMDADLHATATSAYADRNGAALAWLPVVAERSALAHSGWRHAVSGWTLAYAADLNPTGA